MNYLEIVERAKSISAKEYVETIVKEVLHLHTETIEITEIRPHTTSEDYFDAKVSIKLYKTDSITIVSTIAGWYGAKIDIVTIGNSWANITLFVDNDIRKDVSVININMKRITRRKRKSIEEITA